MLKYLTKSHLYVNLTHLKHNYETISKITKGSNVIGIVKGDGYGHGMIECSKILLKTGCKSFYVANINDSIQLRKKFKTVKIYVLSGAINDREFQTLERYKITPIINNYDQLKIIENFNVNK